MLKKDFIIVNQLLTSHTYNSDYNLNICKPSIHQRKMKSRLFLCILGMAIVVISSNILVQFLYGKWLTYGAFTYPLAFLINDLTNRYFGSHAARQVVLFGFVIGLICSLIGTQIVGEFGPLVTLRIAIASGAAFLFAQLADIFVFNKIKIHPWWLKPLGSSLIGSSIDTLIFFTVAFSASLSFIEPGNDVRWANEMVPLLGLGPSLPYWMSLAAADFSVKLSIALFSLIPFKIITNRFQMNLNTKR